MTFSASWRLCVSLLCLGCATAWADEPRIVTNSLGMQFIRIPAGEFLMGSAINDDQADADERPPHRVCITQDFYLGQFEVTQQQYEAVMHENPSWFSATGGGRDLVAGRDVRRYPVENVSWDEATEFCCRLNQLADRKPGEWYRLPTEAEWEYACRAGTTTRYACGDRLKADRANILSDVEPRTRPVGSYEPNTWGLYDLHGNVWEWCHDRYTADAYSSTEAVAPQGPSEGTGRVVRGGDYRFDARQARSTNRDFTRQSRRDLGNGFRVVRTVAAAK
jgi:formylglycine-generating enzyme required for sulfatase activity